MAKKDLGIGGAPGTLRLGARALPLTRAQVGTWPQTSADGVHELRVSIDVECGGAVIDGDPISHAKLHFHGLELSRARIVDHAAGMAIRIEQAGDWSGDLRDDDGKQEPEASLYVNEHGALRGVALLLTDDLVPDVVVVHATGEAEVFAGDLKVPSFELGCRVRHARGVADWLAFMDERRREGEGQAHRERDAQARCRRVVLALIEQGLLVVTEPTARAIDALSALLMEGIRPDDPLDEDAAAAHIAFAASNLFERHAEVEEIFGEVDELSDAVETAWRGGR